MAWAPKPAQDCTAADLQQPLKEWVVNSLHPRPSAKQLPRQSFILLFQVLTARQMSITASENLILPLQKEEKRKAKYKDRRKRRTGFFDGGTSWGVNEKKMNEKEKMSLAFLPKTEFNSYKSSHTLNHLPASDLGLGYGDLVVGKFLLHLMGWGAGEGRGRIHTLVHTGTHTHRT